MWLNGLENLVSSLISLKYFCVHPVYFTKTNNPQYCDTAVQVVAREAFTVLNTCLVDLLGKNPPGAQRVARFIFLFKTNSRSGYLAWEIKSIMSEQIEECSMHNI